MSGGQGGTPRELCTYHGGCHCRAVRFSVQAPRRLDVLECNCSICRATGFLHLIVERQAFRLLSGADNLVEYRFGTGTARHLFCGLCGIKSYYVPRSHPDGYSVNVRCLDEAEVLDLRIARYDGLHWERAREELARRERGGGG